VTQKFDPYAVDVPRMLSQLGLEAEHRGDTWVMRCPSGLHPDKKPSFTIKDVSGEPKHGLGFCHSCKFGGTAAELVAHVLGITLHSAYGWLVERAMGQARDVRRITVELQAPRTRAGMQVPPGVVVAPLTEWPTIAQRYVLDRGITPAQIDQWGLGYAAEGKLAGRIFLPIWDQDGALLHYTARSFTGSPCRYKSADRAEGFDAGAVFGEQAWPEAKQRDAVVVCEGALNALAVQRVAHFPFGALYGSNVSLEHLMKFSTFKRVLILTDADLAGDWAAEKLAAAMVRHLEAVRIVLPRGVDANDLERRDASALRKAIDAASVRRERDEVADM
jgi:DNA primase